MCQPTVFPFAWQSHSFFLLHNSVPVFMFGIGAQRAKVLATKLPCRDTGVLLKQPYAQAVHTFSSKNLEGCF